MRATRIALAVVVMGSLLALLPNLEPAPASASSTPPPQPPSRDRVILWHQAITTSGANGVGARYNSAMAYDAERAQTILFGGSIPPDDVPTFGDTWAWEGTGWSMVASTGPSPRHGHAMAYDGKQIVLFGGIDSNKIAQDDTWTWNGSKWTKVKISPATGSRAPPPRAFTSLAYDSNSSRVLLFGGEDASGKPLGDTWAWNGTTKTWTELHPSTSPPARGRAAMAYDPLADSALLFGGWNGSRVLDDTWIWNGATSNWSRENTGPYPERRQGHTMAYHPATRQIVLVGGSRDVTSGAPCCHATWTWDGDDWGTGPHEAAPVGTRVSPAMAEDGLGRLVLFGGREGARDLRDTMLFSVPTPGTIPTRKAPMEVCATREATAPPLSPPPATTTSVPPSTTTTTRPPGTTVQESVWKQERLLLSPSAREGAAMAFDPVKKETILFGGLNRAGGPCVHNDTWAWNGSAWALKAPGGATAPATPPARYGHTMAYDAERNQVVVFGGSDGGSDLADTWVWNGTSWARRETATTAPSPRARHTMAYDGERKQVVLFGGDHQGRVLADTWIWDGWEWAQHPASNPPARGYAAMAYDPARRNTVLHGGWDGTTRDDTWVWDGSTWQEVNGPGEMFRARPATHSAVMAFDPSSQKVVLRHGASEDPRGGPCDVCTRTLAWDGSTWVGPTLGSFSPEPAAAPSPRMFAGMAEDADGGLVLFGGYGPERGAVARDEPGMEDADRGDTWTYQAVTEPVSLDVGINDETVKVTLEHPEINADGSSTTVATATLTRAGGRVRLPGRQVTFSTNRDVTFSPVVDHRDGTYTTTITASRTPEIETITATDTAPGEVLYLTLVGGPKSGSADLVERGIVVSLDPPSIQADGSSTSKATARVITAGSPAGEEVQFTTNGDVTFSSVTDRGDGTYRATITASRTPGQETIAALASPSGLTGSAVLTEAGNGWFDKSLPASDPAPPARDQSAMAFDAERNQTVMFGGFTGDRKKPFGDTWTWDGSAWTRQHPATSPPARYGHSMAYDAAREQVVLFGGYGRSGYLGDTWTWDGSDWKPHSGASPSPRYRSAMTYDEARGEVVLFGGWKSDGCDMNTGICPAFGDTWTWNGSGWTQRLTTPPPPAPPPTTEVKEFLSAAGEPIVVPLPPPKPGCPGRYCPSDTANPYPSPIAVAGMTDKVAKVTVTLDRLSWTKYGPGDADIMVVAPDGRAVMLMSDACGASIDDPAANPIERSGAITLTFDGAASGTLAANGPCNGTYRPTNISTDECTPFHSPDAFPAPAPPRSFSTSLSDFAGTDPNGTWSLYVVDDCPNHPNPDGEAGRIEGWKLKIATTDAPLRTPGAAASPPPRGWASMAYHGPSGKVILYGGSQAYLQCTSQGSGATQDRVTCGAPFNPLADTWIWDGTSWEQDSSGTNPGLRHSASMVAHPRSGQLVLFGGSSDRGGDVADPEHSDPEGRLDTTRDDTWTWDGRSWAPQTSPAGTPPGRHSAAMAQGPSGTVVMFSGFHAKRPGPRRDPVLPVLVIPPGQEKEFSYLGDTWVYDRRVTATLARGFLPADGKSTASVTAKVVDGSGLGVPGLAVEFTTDGDASLSSTTDHGDGTYSATVMASATDGFETFTVTTPFGSAAATMEEVRAAPCSSRAENPAGSWDDAAPLSAARWRMAVAAGRDGRIYAFGGTPSSDSRDEYGNTPDEFLSTVESYDPCTNTWRSLPPMPGGGRSWASAAAAPEGRIYVVGGMYFTTRQVEVYTPGVGNTPGRWETLPPLPSDRLISASAVGPDGRLYVMGGPSGTGGLCGALRTADVYTPGAGGGPGKWEPVPDMASDRWASAAVTGPDGRILAIGGADGNCTPHNTVEAFDTRDRSWNAITPMPNPRSDFGAAVDNDLVYALGGAGTPAIYSYGTNPATANAEAYSACTGVWLPIRPMPRVRMYHNAAVGGDGRIYVLGGYTDRTATPTDPVGFGVTDIVHAYTPDPLTNPCAKVSVDDQTVQESRSGTAPARFTIHLDRPVLEPVTVNYTTKDGTATAGSDYERTSGTVTFAAGDISDKFVSVSVNGDGVVEGNETFSLELSSSSQAKVISFAQATGTATIVDAGAFDAPGPRTPPPLTIAGTAVAEPFSGSVTANFTVTLERAVAEPVSFGYTTADGTATAGADYTATAGRAEIAPGQTSATLAVPVLGDTSPEPTEHFSVTIANPAGATIATGEARGTIFDAVEGISVGDASVVEGDGGTNPAQFTVTLARPSAEVVTAEFATFDDSAKAFSDYSPTQGTLVFAAGQQSQVITVGAVADSIPELTEYFSLKLSKPKGSTIGWGDGTGTIIDDDGPRPEPRRVPASAALALGSPPPLPPPAPVAQGQAHPQSQAQQQAQQQAQTQAQAQSQGQAQAQAQAEAQAQAGVADERQRERHMERVQISASDAASGSETYLASSPSHRSPIGAAAWIGATVVLGFAVTFSRQGSNHPNRTPVQEPAGSRGTPVSRHLPNERIRGRHRRR